MTLAIFILEDALSVWTNLSKHSLFVWLFVSSLKTGTSCDIHLDELYSVVRRLSRTLKDYCFSYTILETNNEYLLKVVQTNNASSSSKTAIVTIFLSSHPGFQILSG